MQFCNMEWIIIQEKVVNLRAIKVLEYGKVKTELY